MIEIVSATRVNEDNFRYTPLGASLARLNFDTRLVHRIAYRNGNGLPLVYNACIDAQSDSDILLFIHDDVWIDDYFIADRIIDGLETYDVIGIAGNRTIPPNHEGWCFGDPINYSGSVAHAATPFGEVTLVCSQRPPQPCELLDGVLIASKRSKLLDRNVRFDPVFLFHFYDLDFCRRARTAGLTLGTWPIAITHSSGGSFDQGWNDGFTIYKNKWNG